MRRKKVESEKTQDVITRPQIGFKVIRDQAVISKLYDKNLEPIIIVLREGPLTIKELVDEYNEIAEESKSEMTIYRYVKELDKIDIVKEVGKRIKTGQSASETLYGRTAKIFWNLKDKEDYWKSEDSKQIVDTIRDILLLYKENTTINSEDIGALLNKIYKKSSEEMAAFFEKNDDAIDKMISGLTFKEIDKIFDIFGTLILIMKSTDFSEDLEKCGC